LSLVAVKHIVHWTPGRGRIAWGVIEALLNGVSLNVWWQCERSPEVPGKPACPWRIVIDGSVAPCADNIAWLCVPQRTTTDNHYNRCTWSVTSAARVCQRSVTPRRWTARRSHRL